jgi:hypothetical protein
VKPRRFVSVALLAGTLAGCSSGGAALRDSAAGGQFGLNGVHVGDVVWLALPVLDNATDQPVQLLAMKLADVPTSVKVLGYRAENAPTRGGIIMGYRAGDSVAYDPMRAPNVPTSSIVVPPNGRSEDYVMVKLQLLRPVRVDLRQVDVTYRWQGHDYAQTLSMDLILEGGS